MVAPWAVLCRADNASTPYPGRENVTLRNWAQNKEGAADQSH